ncbi:hypothetical protein SAMN05428974_0647 [Sphingopyxis sp. YR583]|uniref:hypothetical protein n=1 Tax=Sphingopyxis sp. YR583 TaxID=1881047 RepID=UPI0008A72224|nr:hypothetical protein [Sphingopyxis sp. YR583]SEH13066.1 hypothetical protein SAMN05428974_0647 [Sphingopyxis sp. YR583]
MNILEKVPASVSRFSLRDIAETRSQSDRIADVADWVVTNIPWTVAVTDCSEFHDRWPLLTRADLAAVEDELNRRCAAIEAGGTDLDTIAAAMTGRPTYCSAAADWLALNPGKSIADHEFFRLFGQLTRAELILAAIDHKQRILRGCRS